jgi:hypothetical protein
VIPESVKRKIVSDLERGKSLRAIAGRYGTSHESVRRIRIEHGIEPSRRARPVTNRDICRWVQAVNRGVSLSSADPTRNCAIIAKHLDRIGVRKIRRKHEIVWTEADTARLLEMWGTVSCAKIAAALGKTRNAVIGRAFRLGLSKPRQAGQWRTIAQAECERSGRTP